MSAAAALAKRQTLKQAGVSDNTCELPPMARDGVKVREDAGAPYQLAVYNGPGTPAELRRNEILVPVME